MKNYKFNLTWMMVALLILSSCEDFLDAKSDKSLAVPTTAKDFQAILDNYPKTLIAEPTDGDIAADGYYISDATYDALPLEDLKLKYTWERHHVPFTNDGAWKQTAVTIYYANVVIEGIEGKKNRNSELDNILGQAYFLRAKSWLNCAFIYSLAYNSKTANTDLGIHLRKNSNFNEVTVRSSVAETYQAILNDLDKAIQLLPEKSPFPTRSSRAAAYGLRARAYLAMGDYPSALDNAQKCLAIYNVLLNYNAMDAQARYPFEIFNAEVIMDTCIPASTILSDTRARISPELYNLFEENDLRKTLLFSPVGQEIAYRGSYRGNISLFGGIATNEQYLIRAECLARLGKSQQAAQVMDELLSTRYRTGAYKKIQISDGTLLLIFILQERRKELMFRGLRWADIKRYNLEGANISLSRTVHGKTYTLEPNSPKFALPVPQDVIDISDVVQNPY